MKHDGRIQPYHYALYIPLPKPCRMLIYLDFVKIPQYISGGTKQTDKKQDHLTMKMQWTLSHHNSQQPTCVIQNMNSYTNVHSSASSSLCQLQI